MQRSITTLALLVVSQLVIAQSRSSTTDAALPSFLDDAGLENSYLFQVATTPSGELWVASSIGLAHYDGYRWQLFTTEHGLPSDFVRSVCFTRSGDVWVGTDDGAGVFSPDGFDRRGTDGQIAGPRVRRVVEDPDGSIWFCCDHWPTPADSAGLTRWRDGRMQTWRAADGLPSDYVSDLFIDSAGHRFVLTDTGLAQFTGDGFTLPLPEVAGYTEPEYVWSAVESPRHGVLFSTRTAIYRLVDGTWDRVALERRQRHTGLRVVATAEGEIYALKHGDVGVLLRWHGAGFEPASSPIRSITGPVEHAAADVEGGLWFAGYDVLRRWHPDPAGWREMRNGGVPALIDASGRLWGTDTDGVWVFDGTNYVREAGLGKKITPTSDGDVWTYSESEIIVCRGGDVDRRETVPSCFARIDRLIASKSAAMWLLGRGDAEFAFLRPDGSWQPLAMPRDHVTVSARPDVDDGLLVVMLHAAEKAAFVVTPTGPSAVELPPPARRTRGALDLGRRPDGALYVFGHVGLWQRGADGDWRAPHELPGRDAILHYENASTLWLGSRGATGGHSGLVRIDAGGVREFPYSPQGSALCTLPDGSTLVPVRGGLLRLPVKGPPRLIASPAPRPIHTIVPDRRGRLWAATDEVLLRYSPDPRSPETEASALATSVTAGEHCAIRVAMLEHLRPRQLDRAPIVSFRVDDGPWSEFEILANSTLAIADLPVGLRHIALRTMDVDGDIDVTPAVLAVRVLPVPLQSQPWFWPAVVILLGALGALLGMGFRARAVRRALRDQLAAEARSRVLESQLTQVQKMDAIGQLAGGVAHDFNNLLTIVLGNSALARAAIAKDHEGVSGSAEQAIDELEYAARRAAALTRRLLAFARQETGNPRPIAASRALQDIERLARRAIASDIEIHTSLQSAGTVMADATQFEQVVLNLMLNAADAMPTGGRIEVELTDVEVTECERCDVGEVGPGRYVRLSVRDTGAGMSEEVRARAFEPFFSTKGIGANTGLGLSIVHGIVTKAGGCVAIRSTEGEGTTIAMLWPQSDATVTVPDALQPVAKTSRPSATVLVCDDEPTVLVLTAKILADAGYEVLTAPSPEEALRIERTRSDVIDLLITDIVMPGSSGRELAQELRRRRPELGVVFVSGYDPGGSERTAIDPDAAFLAKPFSPGQLLEAADATLACSRPRSVR